MSKYAFLLVFAIVAVLACNRVSAVNELPAVGAAAPSFQSHVNNEGKQVSLADFKGKWVVLYFYPKDFTSGCTLEARNFQRDLAKYDAANAVILGVSVDTGRITQRVLREGRIELQTAGGHRCEGFRAVWLDHGVQRRELSARNTFIIDPQGKIAKVFREGKGRRHTARKCWRLWRVCRNSNTD